jgi:hypothetical protein
VTGGHFDGPKLKGRIVSGDDWLLLCPNGVLMLDCRMTLKTNDGHGICMIYSGRRHGPPEVIERMNRGEEVNASEYYHRVAPFFETDSDKYDWLNGIVAVGQRRNGAFTGCAAISNGISMIQTNQFQKAWRHW